jgi:hypothetical protein
MHICPFRWMVGQMCCSSFARIGLLSDGDGIG